MYNSDVKQYEHDLDKAAELLDALGYSEVGEDGIRINTDGERLSFELLASDRMGRVDTAKLFSEQMARAGIEFVVVSMDGMTQEEKVANNEFETAIVGHAGLGYDADYLRKRYAGGDLGASTTELSSTGYSNEEVLSLLQEQRTIMDFEQRKEMLYRIQELMAEDVVEITMYYSYMTSAHRPDVWDGWMYDYDERSVTGCKMSFVFYDEWMESLN
jgi:peptide/nickel transport system substrate-binding protein